MSVEKQEGATVLDVAAIASIVQVAQLLPHGSTVSIPSESTPADRLLAAAQNNGDPKKQPVLLMQDGQNMIVQI